MANRFTSIFRGTNVIQSTLLLPFLEIRKLSLNQKVMSIIWIHKYDIEGTFIEKENLEMARSKLLKDFISGQHSMENILFRLKVIFSDLEDDKVLAWVNGELEGYKKDMPPYRVLKGIPIGTFVVNESVQYTNARVPLVGRLPQKTIDNFVTLNMTESINAIVNMLNSEQRNKICKSIPTEICHSISDYQLQIASMHIAFSPNQLDGIISSVKSKILEVIMLLEKNFENIDELDISTQVENQPNVAESVIVNIQSIIFGDTTEIEIGDRNKFKDSRIGKMLGLDK